MIASLGDADLFLISDPGVRVVTGDGGGNATEVGLPTGLFCPVFIMSCLIFFGEEDALGSSSPRTRRFAGEDVDASIASPLDMFEVWRGDGDDASSL